MKKSIHQILSDFFEEQNKRTKKMVEAESLQRPFKQIVKTEANGNEVRIGVCFN